MTPDSYDWLLLLLGILTGIACFELLRAVVAWLDESDDKKEGR